MKQVYQVWLFGGKVLAFSRARIRIKTVNSGLHFFIATLNRALT